MPVTSPASARRVQELAVLIEQHIQTKGLRPGERYLTTNQVAELLSVSTRLANDAMRLLASRQVLVRKPKAGTLIGSGVRVDDGETPQLFDVVHFLIRQDYYFSERRRMESLMTGLARELPGCSIRFDFVPAFNELAYVERLLAASATERSAFLIAVKSTQLQNRFEKEPSPAVLLGTPYDGISGLSWVDKDQAEVGRLLVRKMLDAGHERIAVVLRDRRGYGDDLMMDAITRELMAAGLGSGALIARSVPTEQALIALTLRSLLSPANHPTALICRNRMILNAAAQVCGELGRRPGADIALALCDTASGLDDLIPIPCARPSAAVDATEEGRLLGRMLIALAHQSPAERKPLHELIPVRL